MLTLQYLQVRQQALDTASLPPLVFQFPPPPLLANVSWQEELTDDEVSAQLQELMRAGTANLRASLPALLGMPASPTAPSPASPFQQVCRDWMVSIHAAPDALRPGSSRLASPPPCSFVCRDPPSAWDDEDAEVEQLLQS
jgi:hypothetical protein